MNFDFKVFCLLQQLTREKLSKEKYRLASALTLKKRIVCIRFNQKKTDPFQAKFGKSKHHIYLHAEIATIKKFLSLYPIEDLTKSTLYVFRYKKSNGWGLSKPCKGCQKAIIAFGVKKVIYSTNQVNSWETVYLRR